MGNYLTKQEQVDLLIDFVVQKIPNETLKLWKVDIKTKSQVIDNLRAMIHKTDKQYFNGLKAHYTVLLPFIDDKYKKIFNYDYYSS